MRNMVIAEGGERTLREMSLINRLIALLSPWGEPPGGQTRKHHISTSSRKTYARSTPLVGGGKLTPGGRLKVFFGSGKGGKTNQKMGVLAKGAKKGRARNESQVPRIQMGE